MNNSMKTKTILILMAFALAAGVFNACKKEQANNEENKVELTDADRNVASRILKFRSRLEHKKANPMLKNTEIVSIDDARLDVETNFNASYSFPDEKYIKTNHETITVELQVTDAANTTVDNMLALYDECFAKVLETYNNSTIQNKELVFVSLKKGEIVNNEQKLDLKVVLGTKQLPGQGWTPFVEADNWKYGNMLGKCDGSSYMDSDAAEQIQEMLDVYQPIYWVSPPYRIVYQIDIASPYILFGHEYKDANNNYLMFHIDKTDDLTDDDICLDYNEMNFHFNGHYTVIYDLMPVTYSKPNNWQCIGWDINGRRADYFDDFGMYHNRIRHESTLTYAYRYIVRIDEIAEPTSLSIL